MLTPSLPFSRPLHGLPSGSPADPSDESLGYFHSSAHADSEVATFCAKRPACLSSVLSKPIYPAALTCYQLLASGEFNREPSIV